MIKARMTAIDGRTVFFFGLSDANLDFLRVGKAIVVKLAEMGGPADAEVCISWGETEDAIVAQLQAAGMEIPS